MTFTELANLAAEALGHIRANAGLNGSELAAAKRFANLMLGSANTQSLLIFTRRRDEYDMVALQQEYTIGDPAGVLTDLAGVRPTKVSQGDVNLFLADDLRRPIHVVDQREWALIRKQEIYTYPNQVYYDYANYSPDSTPAIFPTFRFYPIPAAAYKWELYTPQQLSQIENVTDELVFPPGYEEHWVYALGKRLATLLRRPITPEFAELARKAEANIKSFNSSPPPKFEPEAGVVGRQGAFFNWLTRETY